MPSYTAKCLTCGFARKDGSKTGATNAALKSHARKRPDCPGNIHVFSPKGVDTGPVGKRREDEPKPKLRQKQTAPEIHFCPHCGFSIGLLRMAVGAVERMQ